MRSTRWLRLPAIHDGTKNGVIVCKVIDGRKFLHSQGIMHQDLAPANILVDEQGFAMLGDMSGNRFVC
jgi:serine/threonine protein kinase